MSWWPWRSSGGSGKRVGGAAAVEVATEERGLGMLVVVVVAVVEGNGVEEMPALELEEPGVR